MVPDAEQLILIARSIGFGRVGVVDLSDHVLDRLAPALDRYRDWLAAGYGGEMTYLQRQVSLRAQPAGLMMHPPKTLRAIVVTLDYLSAPAAQWRRQHEEAVRSPERAVVSVYARGRDYHMVMRQRLRRLSRALEDCWGHTGHQFRACVDSAPVLEIELARQCGLGWRGKHTLLLNRDHGSMFFLGVLLTDMPLAPLMAQPAQHESDAGHCGSCTECLRACPTQAFVGPYQLDARRCISYLTIELKGSIPEGLRPLIGNRIYGCDDCQQVCPWNQYAQQASLPDFDVRHGLDESSLVALWGWTEEEFQLRHQGSAILRIGYQRWLRNIAVAMGNALRSQALSADARRSLVSALRQRIAQVSPMVREHIDWALAQGLDNAHPERDGHH